jgi:hypothetical protein
MFMVELGYFLPPIIRDDDVCVLKRDRYLSTVPYLPCYRATVLIHPE